MASAAHLREEPVQNTPVDPEEVGRSVDSGISVCHDLILTAERGGRGPIFKNDEVGPI
jgi:hypothetical protein